MLIASQDNVLVELTPTVCRPVFIDFGLAGILDNAVAETKISSSVRNKGSIPYMAPELLFFETAPPRRKQSNVYSFVLLALEVSVSPHEVRGARGLKWNFVDSFRQHRLPSRSSWEWGRHTDEHRSSDPFPESWEVREHGGQPILDYDDGMLAVCECRPTLNRDTARSTYSHDTRRSLGPVVCFVEINPRIDSIISGQGTIHVPVCPTILD